MKLFLIQILGQKKRTVKENHMLKARVHDVRNFSKMYMYYSGAPKRGQQYLLSKLLRILICKVILTS